MLLADSSSVHSMFEAHLSLLTAVFNAFSCKQWEPTGSLPRGQATLRKNKQSAACTWWLQMFHVHYINYDSKIAHLLNKFLNKNGMSKRTLGTALTCSHFESMQISCSRSKLRATTIKKDPDSFTNLRYCNNSLNDRYRFLL